MAKKHRITYNNNKEDAFLVHMNNGIKKFIPTNNRLYHYHPQKLGQNYKSLQDYNMIQTVKENKKRYSKQDQKRATRAQKLLHVFDGPSERDTKTMLDMNYIKNCPVISKDTTIAQDIFGQDRDNLKGKSRKLPPKPVVINKIDLPSEFNNIQDLELFIDIMFVNGMAFMTCIDDPNWYRATCYLPNCKAEELYKGLGHMTRFYNGARHTIKMIHIDNKFKPITDEVKMRWT